MPTRQLDIFLYNVTWTTILPTLLLAGVTTWVMETGAFLVTVKESMLGIAGMTLPSAHAECIQ